MTKERRKKVLSPKEIAALREEKEKAAELSPAARQRRFIINFGVGMLLTAFITSSGITCVSMNSPSARKAEQQQADNGKPVDPAQAEIERWQKEAETKPNDASVLANLAFFHMQRGDHNFKNKDEAKKDYDEASQKLDAALKVNPDYSFALRLRAQLEERQEKFDQAKADLELALKVAQKPVDAKDPEKEAKETNAKGDQVQALTGLAELAYHKKDYKAAIAHLDQAIKLDPGSMEAYGERAEALIEDKQPEAARKDLQTLMQITQAMAPSQSTMMFAQRAQMMLYQLDMPAPSISGTPKILATPGASTPAVSSASPAPVVVPTAAVTPAVSATP